MLVFQGRMSDGGLHRYSSQLFISQQWNHLFCYADVLLKQVSSSRLLSADSQGITWEMGSCLFTSTSQSPPPSLDKLTTFLEFLFLLSTFLWNILLQQEPKKKKVSNGKTIKGLFGSCVQGVNNKPHFLKCLRKECCDVKFQRKTREQNQAVSYDNAPRNTKKNSPFTQKGISHALEKNAIRTT